MRGPRPRQEHMAKVWDESQDVGRPDVTDVIEKALDKVSAQARLFPDLYAHQITAALLKAGLITKEPS